jgi:hypothetical protein
MIEPKPFNATKWQLEASFKYDVLCFLNTLSDDPFYLTYYRSEYEQFEPRLTTEVRKALATLKTKLKDEAKMIISAQLCLIFSAIEAQTLAELIEVIHDTTQLRLNFSQTSYYDEESWQVFESVKGELAQILAFLKKLDFEQYWQHNMLPALTERIRSLESELKDYDVVSQVERHLGTALSSPLIRVYVLYFTKPHGIKVTGTRFITAPSWPTNIVVRTAAHEMMHPPFDLANSPQLGETIERLKQDQFLMKVFSEHNSDFGYNTLKGLIEEDCVQALDQLIAEQLGVATPPQKRWEENDEGLHVFAACLYSILRQENYSAKARAGSFQDYLITLLHTRLLPGQLEVIYHRFMEA